MTEDGTTDVLTDEDILTVVPGTATPLKAQESDTDGTDKKDGVDGDGDAKDGVDGDAKDADGTDSHDTDGTDSKDTDGTDSVS
jgi:hypothetical protein